MWCARGARRLEAFLNQDRFGHNHHPPSIGGRALLSGSFSGKASSALRPNGNLRPIKCERWFGLNLSAVRKGTQLEGSLWLGWCERVFVRIRGLLDSPEAWRPRSPISERTRVLAQVQNQHGAQSDILAFVLPLAGRRGGHSSVCFTLRVSCVTCVLCDVRPV